MKRTTEDGRREGDDEKADGEKDEDEKGIAESGSGPTTRSIRGTPNVERVNRFSKQSE